MTDSCLGNFGGTAEGRSGGADKRIESSGGEWRGSTGPDSCCPLFGDIPTGAVSTVVWGEAQPGVFEVQLCYYMDELICAAIIQSTHHVWRQLQSFRQLQIYAEPSQSCTAEKVETRWKIPNNITGVWCTAFCISKCLAYHLRRKIRILIITLVRQTHWSTFNFCCGWDWFITDI